MLLNRSGISLGKRCSSAMLRPSTYPRFLKPSTSAVNNGPSSSGLPACHRTPFLGCGPSAAPRHERPRRRCATEKRDKLRAASRRPPIEDPAECWGRRRPETKPRSFYEIDAELTDWHSTPMLERATSALPLGQLSANNALDRIWNAPLFRYRWPCPLWVKSRHLQRTSRCPLSAKSGHRGCPQERGYFTPLG